MRVEFGWGKRRLWSAPLIGVVVLLLARAAAAGVVFDFDSFTPGDDIEGINLGDLTLINGSSDIFNHEGIYVHGPTGFGYHSPFNTISSGEQETIIGILDTPAVTVSVWAGAINRGVSRAAGLTVFDSNGTELGHTAVVIPEDDTVFHQLVISAPDIARFELSKSDHTGFDDLSFTPQLHKSRWS